MAFDAYLDAHVGFHVLARLGASFFALPEPGFEAANLVDN